MKSLSEKPTRRHRKDRPMATISLRLPEDLIDDLKEMAPIVGFGGYQPLIRAYISQGLRADEALLEKPEIQTLRKTLKRHGVAEEVISEAVAEIILKRA